MLLLQDNKLIKKIGLNWDQATLASCNYNIVITTLHI